MDNNRLIMKKIMRISRLVEAGANQRLTPSDLHFSEWGIIRVLEENSSRMTQTMLAELWSVEPSAISRSLRRLEQKGYIIRVTGEDRRAKYVLLTDKAKERFLIWENIAFNYRSELLACISDDEKETLLALLDRIYQCSGQTIKGAGSPN